MRAIAQWIRRLYDWTLSWAETRYGLPALFVLAFAEASFFPIPPDVLLLALALGKPKRAFVFAAVATLGSVLGGILGYYIGWGFWSISQDFFFDYVPGFSEHNFERVKAAYDESAFITLLTAAFTPIPYKIFTIAGGVFKISLTALIFASLVGRSMRFFMVAGLIYLLGPSVKQLIDRYFDKLALAFGVLLIGGFVMLKWLI